MAKVRVYELAKELNMDSKELVEKLKAGGLNIKNYMSTLDEQAAARARDLITGKVSEVVEEKRIKPTVIRRRRKTVPVAKPAEEVKGETPEEPTAPEAQEVSKAREKVSVKEEAPEEKPKKVKEAAEEEIPKPEERPEPEKEEMVSAGEAPAPEEEKQAEAPAPPEEAPPTPGEAEPKPEEEPEKPEEVKKAKVKEKKKAKKKKAHQPAKIIRLPEEGPLKEILAKEVSKPEKVEPKGPPIPEVVVPVSEKKEKVSKKKKEKKRAERDVAVPKRSIRQKKIEIFERADLYEGRKTKPKRKEGKGREAQKRLKRTEITQPKAIKRRIRVQEKVSVGELAKAMGVKAVELIKKLMAQGVMANVNQSLDYETASLVADDFGYELELDKLDIKSLIPEVEEKPEDLVRRPPVVTIMGHVDHGKTSLLDYIRKSNIISGESGGITQHIGAYYVDRPEGDIVFLDTPGHEAFTAMRARGAKVTDLIVLVVAADDGVMPQTREAINHARAADIPIIVAVNKMDKPDANPEKVRRELAEMELVPEEWGGDTIFGYVSAKTGEGVDELLELILLQAELLELKANPKKPAIGTIIEAKLDKSRGALATVLIKDGTLKQGDDFICGDYFGRVRAMLNSHGKRIKTAGPSEPVEIYGISGVPMAGDEFVVVQDEKKARQFIEQRQAQMRERETGRRGIVSLDDLFEKIKEGEVKELNIVLKADVQGSLEALSDSLLKQSTSEVKLKIIHSSTGAITETDVMLASASGAIVIGFNVRANQRVTEIAEKEQVDIRYYDVIYNVIQDIRMAMAGLLEPVLKEKTIGRVEVKETFHVPKVGTVAGCYVTDGFVERNSNVRLVRDGVVVFDGKLASLKRFKDDVREVQAGYECGIGLEHYQDIKPGDILEIYQMEEVEAEL
ncbi:MAG: translation initiation factor IF-2 [Deltaproteobacteria bacterium]|nr:translation initiation factor IF-2 [Deltaproteobacteria bacterium]MBW2128448.1 translation initiation factor IF-2 [Deltaproteobacteria bacterium]